MDRDQIFRFRQRRRGPQETFNTVFIVPTGIDAECGGHAGDATPALRLVAQVSDRVVTHPNVVNASDINEMPENCFYVEGSVLSRLLMGTVGLQKVRANRLGIIIEDHFEKVYTDATINAVSAARATLGCEFSRVIVTPNKIKMKIEYASSGRATGRVERFEEFYQLLQAMKADCDAIAVSSLVDIPKSLFLAYWHGKGEVVNPWGGVEAMLTHAISCLTNLPSAHSPMMESQEFASVHLPVSDPRMAAEAISTTFLHCILKGLYRSPRIVPLGSDAAVCSLTVADIDCLILPDGVVGLPTLAAFAQGIPVIAVRENRNMMRNSLAEYAGDTGRLYFAENYLEAAGIVAALRGGIAPDTVKRPIPFTRVERV